MLGDHNAITNSNTSAPGGAAQCYAVKLYVADQFDAISGTYVMVSNLVSNLSGVTGTGSGGGDNPPTAWAVKQALSSCLTYEELTYSSSGSGGNSSSGSGGNNSSSGSGAYENETGGAISDDITYDIL